MSGDDVAQVNAQYQVETYLGVTGNGTPGYAPPVTLDVWATRKRQLVRDGGGEQVLSQSSISSAGLDHVDTLTPKTRVTLTATRNADGTWTAVTGEASTTVITRQVSNGGDFIAGLDRVKAYLQ